MTWLSFLIISSFPEFKLQIASIAVGSNVTSCHMIMMSDFVMFKIFTTKFAILCFHVDPSLFFSQWIHFIDLWDYIWYEFFLLFQMIMKTSITCGPLYVKLSPVNFGSWATLRQENPLGLCNYFVTDFDTVPLSSTERDMFQSRNIVPLGQADVLAKFLNFKMLYSISPSSLGDGYSKRWGGWLLRSGICDLKKPSVLKQYRQ